MEKIVHYGVAAIILLGYGVLIFSMYNRYVFTDQQAANWDHAQTLLGGLNAIVFTAAGVLLGSSVQQVRTAEAKATNAEVKAEVEKVAALRGGKIVQRDAGGEPIGGAAASADEALLKIGALVGANT
jgi:hypothetical protein